MNKETAVCYRFYDKKGRRLALFCDFKDEVTAKLVIIPCSKADQFNKKEALAMYEDIIAGNEVPSAEIVELTILPEERTLKTLFRYAFNNLYELKERYKMVKTKILRKIKYA